MPKYRRYLVESQAKVKVIAQAESNTADIFRFVAFAAIFTSFFFFFSSNLWHALTGG